MYIQTINTEQLLGPLNEVELKYAPKELFLAGAPSLLEVGARVSIVGSRKSSPEGLARARKLARLLAQNGVVTVSGLASGIDSSAHTSAVDSGGRTIAVLGTPLDTVYPRENARLQETIADSHLLISQFQIGKRVHKSNFVIRNRTMALFSDATVIIEAADGSGSLHQGWESIRLGRQLFITKAIAENKQLNWPGEFLNYGAKILSDETLEELFNALPQRIPTLDNVAVPF